MSRNLGVFNFGGSSVVGNLREVWSAASILFTILIAVTTAEPLYTHCCGENSAHSQRTFQKRISLSVTKVSVRDVVDTLREDHGIRVSFIEESVKPSEEKIALVFQDTPVELVLDSLVSQAPSYRYQVVGTRLLLYADEPKYGLTVDQIEIVDVARLKASGKYTAVLRARFREFATLIPAAFRGNPTVDLHGDPVTLESRATVLEHLVQLLGTDDDVVFSIVKNRGGDFELSFSHVTGSGVFR